MPSSSWAPGEGMAGSGRNQRAPASARIPVGREGAIVEDRRWSDNAALTAEPAAPSLRRYLLAALIFLLLVAAGGLAALLTRRGAP